MEELGLKEGAEEVVESIESALDGEDWLLESNVEIQIGEDITAQDQHEVSPEELLNDMPTLRVGTGFQSLGDADDEGDSRKTSVAAALDDRRLISPVNTLAWPTLGQIGI